MDVKMQTFSVRPSLSLEGIHAMYTPCCTTLLNAFIAAALPVYPALHEVDFERRTCRFSYRYSSHGPFYLSHLSESDVPCEEAHTSMPMPCHTARAANKVATSRWVMSTGPNLTMLSGNLGKLRHVKRCAEQPSRRPRIAVPFPHLSCHNDFILHGKMYRPYDTAHATYIMRGQL